MQDVPETASTVFLFDVYTSEGKIFSRSHELAADTLPTAARALTGPLRSVLLSYKI